MRVYLKDGSAQTSFTCCHTEIEVADATFHLTQSQSTDTGPTSPSTDPITSGAWQGSHWSASFQVTGMTRPQKNPVSSGRRSEEIVFMLLSLLFVFLFFSPSSFSSSSSPSSSSFSSFFSFFFFFFFFFCRIYTYQCGHKVETMR